VRRYCEVPDKKAHDPNGEGLQKDYSTVVERLCEKSAKE
jgi:hypothetical protein